MIPFDPLFTNAHLQTIAGAFWRRPNAPAATLQARYFQTEPGVQVLVHSQAPPQRCQGVLLMVHGLEGSSEGGYMRSAAAAALQAGFAVHRLNIRSCGGTERLANTLYHAGLTSDIQRVAQLLVEEHRSPLVLAGFSLGGNMSLKLAGELGERARDLFSSVVAVSTPIDLRACAEALNHPSNWLYQQRFLQNMEARLRRRHALMPEIFSLDGLQGVRSVYEFDDRVTAQFFRFGSAERYYGTQSAALFLDTIRIPTLLVQAKDDPMIPFSVYDHPAFRRNTFLKLLAVDHGGHVGFLAKGPRRFWVDQVLVAWMTAIGNNRQECFVPSL